MMSFICSCRNKKYMYVNNAVFPVLLLSYLASNSHVVLVLRDQGQGDDDDDVFPVLLLSFLASNTHVATFAENENFMTIARKIDEEKNWNGIYLALYKGESQEFRVWPKLPSPWTPLSMDAGLVRTSVCRVRIGRGQLGA
jgi:hypothetical protein